MLSPMYGQLVESKNLLTPSPREQNPTNLNLTSTLNLKTEKIEIAYHVENFATKCFQIFFFNKSDLDVIMTSSNCNLLSIFVIFGV